MRVKALKSFMSPIYGDVSAGQYINIESGIFRFWVSAGLVESAEQIPALLKKPEIKPAIQIMPEIKPQIFETEKKRGRRKKVNHADENNHAAEH
jgi:hypothetical protein